MKEERKKQNKFVKAGVTVGVLCGIVFIVALLIVSNISHVVQPQVEKERVWQRVYVWTPLGEGSPTGSGFLEIFFINHSAAPATCYDENTSATLESWCVANMPGKTPYATADDFNVELASEVSFDIVIRVRFNLTHVGDGADFIDTRADCQITTSCTSWADGENDANTSATGYVVSGNNTAWGYIYINFYWNADDNNGYQISDDAVLTISEIYIEAKF